MTKFLTTKEAIIDWLEKYYITDYEFISDETYGYVVNVNGSVDLSNQNLSMIPTKFAKVTGSFYCYNNQLTSLEFCPTHVGDHFECHSNQLTSLEFCPTHVGGDFYCENNPLLQEIQAITEFKDIYQCHQAVKIRLAKDCLEQKLSDQPLILSQSHSKMKI